mmetsp:Transcript_39722/g.94129  ORF Transcript_39722/g.94129 Transcript_39722/m.94129 type:complete len:211 (-) Transcript_39722:89-721(-)|eukprot:CAMPEP_0180269014 /NCGR_PEP_ID=MMETSP0988-20121125/2417_1 /TAXON_ID=697907 /ORGANISM="non described non described, Strain CCMP2293" /LENGTH=210 /DNA_ID=CAMNT_0022239853 /DNA_START=236 /DNA_END=868 /DNA_ORIENTATION=+
MPAPADDASGTGAIDTSAKKDIEDAGEKREIGGDAVWTLSTAKPGNGVEQIRDNNTETYWQSDGPQPHLINIQFHKKVSVKEIAIYCDFKHDESYTPSKISIRAGTHFHDLQEVKEVTLDEPTGWLSVPLSQRDLTFTEQDATGGSAGRDESLRAFMLQIAVLANHENGRDSHIRQIKVFGPRPDPIGLGFSDGGQGFSTLEFSVFSSVR